MKDPGFRRIERLVELLLGDELELEPDDRGRALSLAHAIYFRPGDVPARAALFLGELGGRGVDLELARMLDALDEARGYHLSLDRPARHLQRATSEPSLVLGAGRAPNTEST